MNKFEIQRLKECERIHWQAIGILQDGCRFKRSIAFDEFLRVSCGRIPDYAWSLNIRYPILRRFAIIDDLCNMQYYTDEQLSDIFMVLQIAYKRFHPSNPLIQIAKRKRLRLRH